MNTFDGKCTCGEIQYRMKDEPMIVHCCHCTWCQRETGASFALNALIEADRVELLSGKPEVIETPSNSGKGQKIHRCPRCKIALWSNYSGAGSLLHFVRVGTLIKAGLFPPDIHIFTSTKQPWVILSPETPTFAEYYNRDEIWSRESLARRAAVMATVKK